MARGVYKFNPFQTEKRKPNFNKRFINNHDPDFKDTMLLRGKGEFSVHTDLAFEAYLKKLRGTK